VVALSTPVLGRSGPRQSPVEPEADLLDEDAAEEVRNARSHAPTRIGAERRILGVTERMPQEPVGVEPIGLGEYGGVAMAFVDEDSQEPARRDPVVTDVHRHRDPPVEILALLQAQRLEHDSRAEVRGL
jgi:hypothetical protein